MEPKATIRRTRELLNVVYDALNSSASGVIITDPKGRIIYVNPSFLAIFGCHDKSEVLDKNATDLFTEEEFKSFSDVEAIIDESRRRSIAWTASAVALLFCMVYLMPKRGCFGQVFSFRLKDDVYPCTPPDRYTA